jgi:hypothetical protein
MIGVKISGGITFEESTDSQTKVQITMGCNSGHEIIIQLANGKSATISQECEITVEGVDTAKL